ncbi:MAG: aminotransferase class IV [Bryobacteraceae bacterium]|jgi:branched-chain amino acid aminotransferase
MHRLVLHNDDVCEASAKVLAPGQVGLASGWGVFSTLRIVRGVPFAFERHWERMKRDAATLRVPFPADPDYIHSRLLRLIAANQVENGTARTIVVRNRGGIWEGSPDRDFDLLAFTASRKDWGAGVKLAVHEQARHAGSRFRGVKCLSWALNLVMLEEAQARGCDEVLLLNERGEVSECTSANVFIAREGEVLTPPLDSGCLPGVTREILIEIAPAEGIPIREKTLHLEDFMTASEVFITSTTRNLLPVVSIDGRPLRLLNQVRDALEAAFERTVDKYTASYASSLS